MIPCHYCWHNGGERVRASTVVPQFAPEDTVEYIAVCHMHFNGWYDGIPLAHQLQPHAICTDDHDRYAAYLKSL